VTHADRARHEAGEVWHLPPLFFADRIGRDAP
jgi:hypothetical protein